MSYKPPKFQIFLAKTANLTADLSTKYNRFKLSDEIILSSPDVEVSTLRLLFVRIHELTDPEKCKTKKEKEKDLFRLLVDEIRKTDINNEESARTSILFLLGALFHRYFRIIAGYNTDPRLWISEPKHCDLFIGIRKALGLKDIPEKQKKEVYLASDLEKLDVTTVVNALMVFQKNMLALEGPDKQPRYKRYPVFLENANFETQLTEMIKGQKQRDVNNQLAQFEAIRFLQYLANQMERDRPLMESRLKSWVDDLIYQHPNYTEHSVEQFKAHLVEYIKKNKDKDSSNDFTLFQGSFPLVLASTKLKEIFNQVLNDSQNKKNYATKLTDIVNALYLSICSNIIVGGYILVQHSNNCSSELKISLADVLKAPEGINTEDTYWSLNLLKDYLKINTHAVLECGFFGGRSNFESNLSNLRDHYKKQFEAEAEAAAEAKKKQQATTSASM